MVACPGIPSVEWRMTIQHYGWPSSPFSAKTRAYLKAIQADFRDVEPHALTLYRKIQPAIGYIMMPTVELEDGTFLQDSSRIIDHFESLPGIPSILPTTPKQRLCSVLLEVFADEWLPLIAMCTRWKIPENRHFAQTDFGNCAFPWLPSFVSRGLAKPMAAKMSSYLPVLGITDATTPQIFSWLEELSAQLNTHLSDHSFLFGERPSLADFALAAPLYAHVWRDPGSRHYIENNPRLLSWLQAVQAGPAIAGDYLQDDVVPETLLPILRHQREAQFPILRETFERVHAKVTGPDFNGKLPRSLGMAPITVGGASADRRVLVMNQWKAQRIYDTIDGFVPDTREAVLSWATDVLGYAQELREPPKTRVEYQGYRLGVAVGGA